MNTSRRSAFVAGIVVVFLVLLWAAQRWLLKSANEPRNAKSETAPAYPKLADMIPPPVSDDQNFAKTPFLAPLFDVKLNFRPGENRYRDPDGFDRAQNFAKDLPTLKFGGWQVGRKTDVIGWPPESFEEFAPVLAELRIASHRSYCRFDIRYQDGANALLPHLAVLKRLCTLLSLRASAQLATRQTNQAFDDATLSFYLADTIKNEPTLISHLVRLVCLQAAIQPVYEGLAERRWSDAQLQELQARLQNADLLAELKQALRGEQGFGNQIIEQLRDKRDLKEIAALFPQMDAKAMRQMPRAWFDRNQRSYNRLFDDFVLQGINVEARRVFPATSQNNLALAEKEFAQKQDLQTDDYAMARLLIPALSKVHQKFAHAQTVVAQASIACALERCRLVNGKFPEKLDDLAPRFIDPLPHDLITGEPLTYFHREDGQLLLSSVGWKEQEDNGEVGLGQKANDFGDWTWRYPAK